MGTKIISAMRKRTTKVILYDGDLTVWVHTHLPAIGEIIYAEIKKHNDGEMYVISSLYVDLLTCIADVEIKPDTDNNEAILFDIWFRGKTGNTIEDHDNYLSLISAEFTRHVQKEAVTNTRVNLPQSPEITQGERPAEDSPLEPSTTESNPNIGKRQLMPT